jgi:hypothetical protein
MVRPDCLGLATLAALHTTLDAQRPLRKIPSLPVPFPPCAASRHLSIVVAAAAEERAKPGGREEVIELYDQ